MSAKTNATARKARRLKLPVLVSDAELESYRRAATSDDRTTSGWVRRILNLAAGKESGTTPG